MEAHNRFAEQVGELGGKIVGGKALQPTSDRHHDPRRRRHRRAVRGDQGGARRLLPDRGGRPRPGDRDRQALPGAVRRRRGPTDHGLRVGAQPWPTSAGAVADAHRREWAFVLAATARVAGDIDLAEECVQDAYVAALEAWTRDGVPANPGAWLTTTARRRALDALRAGPDAAHQAAAAGRARRRRGAGGRADGRPT